LIHRVPVLISIERKGSIIKYCLIAFLALFLATALKSLVRQCEETSDGSASGTRAVFQVVDIYLYRSLFDKKCWLKHFYICVPRPCNTLEYIRHVLLFKCLLLHKTRGVIDAYVMTSCWHLDDTWGSDAGLKPVGEVPTCLESAAPSPLYVLTYAKHKVSSSRRSMSALSRHPSE